MNLSFRWWFLSIASAVSLAAGPQAHAEFLQPVAAFASNGQATQDALINGLGFTDPGIGSPQSLHSRDGGEMWSGVGSIRESVTFDLGTAVNLTKVYIWNYNVQDATDVGMKDVEVQVSSGTDPATANFNSIATISLAEGGEAAQTFNLVGTNVRLVKLKGVSNWGQGYTVGLAEVRFESGDITGSVPVITLNSPHDGDEISFGTDISLDARVTDGDADLAKVEFFDGTTLLTNKTAAPFTPFTAAWKGAARGEHTLRVVATDKSGKVAWVSVNLTVRELVADRILKIDDTADEGPGVNQITYVGAWNLAQGGDSDPRYLHNDHYNASNNRNDYFEVRFFGVMIEVFGTVASHHGSGMASIDGGPESRVNYKTPQRAEQVFVWGSPILRNGEHVLRIRLTGDGVVTADRFDVSVSDKPVVTTATIKEVVATAPKLVITMEDAASSVVNPASVQLTLDGQIVAATVTKAAPLTTITHTPATPFQPGSTHLVRVDARDQAGASLSAEQSFSLPAPFFPLTGVPGPVSTAGNWGVRQIWNAGRADSVVSALDIATRAAQPGFTGRLHDTTASSVNFALSSNPGAGALFIDKLPLPAETEGLSPSDFVIVAHARVRIPRNGDWTVGVHSDDGFALRFIGAPFESVNGAGFQDENFPEYMGFLTESGNSNTRGILRGIAAGTYDIEFIAFQRVGGSYYEIYAAEGAFTDDMETDQWQLIGAPGGLEILAGPKGNLTVRGIAKVANRITIEFDSPDPDGAHALQESSDLKSWRTAPGALFEKGANGMRVSVDIGSAPATFYRIVAGP